MNLPRTEMSNPASRDIDLWDTAEIVDLMNREDATVATRVRKVLPAITQATDAVIASLATGGRVFYAGSGSSGRQAVLDAAELVPTFGEPGKRVQALISGGHGALWTADEGAEDDFAAGQREIGVHGIGGGDTVIGIAASGRTPYVVGTLTAAKSCGATVVAIVGAPGPVATPADITINVDVGPEVIAGSTRLKNATAQKMILNMISTAAMIRLGRTYSNLMAGASSHNTKLNRRAGELLAQAADVPMAQAAESLREAGNKVDVALVSLLTGQEPGQSVERLRDAKGSITAALGRDHRNRTKATSHPLSGAFDVVARAVGEGDGGIPGAVAAVVWRGEFYGPQAFGLAVRTATRLAMQPDTIFDVASLTKVMATLPSILVLLERGLVRLDDTVAGFLPEFAQSGKDKVTLRHLLTHTSRLPAHIDLWDRGLSREDIVAEISAMPLVEPTRLGQDVIYSDLGFIILGEIVSAVTGMSLASFAEKNIFIPLGMQDTCFVPPADNRPRIAATEFRQDLGRLMWGEVHDENAHALGGIAGHAGLFSTARDVMLFANMWLSGSHAEGCKVLAPATLRLATTPQTARPEPRGLGWLMPSATLCSGGDLVSPRAFGHTGFTGTSLWCVPEHDLGIVLLTNRVHAGRQGTEIYPLRARFSNAVVAALSRRTGVSDHE